MNNLFSLAKEGVSAYQSHSKQSDASTTGGSEYNTPHHSDQGDSRKQSYSPKIDHDEAIRAAEEHGSGNSDLFSTALSFLSDKGADHSHPINEDEVVQAHKKVYENKDTSGLSANSIGSAAALQVVKQFTSGSSSQKSGGNMQTQLISMAMAEATKIFDKSGGKGDKQDAVNGAAVTVMKLLVQSKLGGAPTTGGSNSGGLGGLLSLVSKFA